MNFSIGQVDFKIEFPKLTTGWSVNIEVQAPIADKFLDLFLTIAENNPKPFALRVAVEDAREVG